MSDEKPLHVRVAEALGCKTERNQSPGGIGPWWTCGCAPQGVYWPHGQGISPILHDYDTDWSATGPLMIRYGIGLQAPEKPRCGFGSDLWAAYDVWTDTTEPHAQPLVAVCHLILALHAAGKLPTR